MPAYLSTANYVNEHQISAAVLFSVLSDNLQYLRHLIFAKRLVLKNKTSFVHFKVTAKNNFNELDLWNYLFLFFIYILAHDQCGFIKIKFTSLWRSCQIMLSIRNTVQLAFYNADKICNFTPVSKLKLPLHCLWRQTNCFERQNYVNCVMKMNFHAPYFILINSVRVIVPFRPNPSFS